MERKNAILSRAIEKFAEVLDNNGCFSVPNEIKTARKDTLHRKTQLENSLRHVLLKI